MSNKLIAALVVIITLAALPASANAAGLERAPDPFVYCANTAAAKMTRSDLSRCEALDHAKIEVDKVRDEDRSTPLKMTAADIELGAALCAINNPTCTHEIRRNIEKLLSTCREAIHRPVPECIDVLNGILANAEHK
jgi:hypothetical protein